MRTLEEQREKLQGAAEATSRLRLRHATTDPISGERAVLLTEADAALRNQEVQALTLIAMELERIAGKVETRVQVVDGATTGLVTRLARYVVEEANAPGEQGAPATQLLKEAEAALANISCSHDDALGQGRH